MIGKTNVSSNISIDLSSLDISANKVIAGTKFVNTNGDIDIGTLPYLNTNTFGGSDSSSFNNSPIVDKAWNQYVGAFDYNLNGYFNGLTRVHIPNIIPTNIKAGVKVGAKNAYIEGTFTSDANAQSQYMLSGQTAYVNGNKVYGSMPYRGSMVHGPTSGLNNSGVWYYLPYGYYEEPGQPHPWVYRTREEVAATIGLTSNKMIKGQSCLNINGAVNWVYTTLEFIIDTDQYPTYISLSNIRDYDGGKLIWEGMVHPEWPYAIFNRYGCQAILGKGGSERYMIFVEDKRVISFKILRDSSGYTRIYLASTSSSICVTNIACIGGTTADING